jgi:hypothetical protein
MKKIIVALFEISLIACSSPSEAGPSDEEKAIFSGECQKFIKDNAPIVGGAGRVETAVFDIYEKKGKLVVEVGYKQGTFNNTYTTRLCVIDSDKGTMSSPSPLNDSEWRK